MKFDLSMVISLLLAVLCVVGGMQLASWLAASEKTPWPEIGMVGGWVIYRAGWSWWKKQRQTPG